MTKQAYQSLIKHKHKLIGGKFEGPTWRVEIKDLVLDGDIFTVIGEGKTVSESIKSLKLITHTGIVPLGVLEFQGPKIRWKLTMAKYVKKGTANAKPV